MSVSIVLVSTETVENIGAAARAMKNTGFRDLRLVAPPRNWKTGAEKMAMSAKDILTEAKVFSSLSKSIADAQWVLGLTRRQGAKRGLFLPFESAIQKIKTGAVQKNIALVFGKESKGLSNADLAFCDKLVTIPSHADYASLNLAQAVMVMCFTLFVSPSKRTFENDIRLLPKNEIERVLEKIKEMLMALDYRDTGAKLQSRILATFRDLFKRSGLVSREAEMFKGLSRRIINGPRSTVKNLHEIRDFV